MKLFGINAIYFDISADGNITLSPLASLSSVTKDTYKLEVIAYNDDEESNRAKFVITVVNHDIPRLADISLNVDENATDGAVLGNLTIYTGGSAPINYIGLSGNGAEDFIVSLLGEITLSPTASLDFNNKNLYSLKAVATNIKGASPSVNVSIAVNQINPPVKIPLLMMESS